MLRELWSIHHCSQLPVIRQAQSFARAALPCGVLLSGFCEQWTCSKVAPCARGVIRCEASHSGGFVLVIFNVTMTGCVGRCASSVPRGSARRFAFVVLIATDSAS
jgi:hypothetical protein